jgi:hypothetical protein
MGTMVSAMAIVFFLKADTIRDITTS